jgi:hypothetical protein
MTTKEYSYDAATDSLVIAVTVYKAGRPITEYTDTARLCDADAQDLQDALDSADAYSDYEFLLDDDAEDFDRELRIAYRSCFMTVDEAVAMDAAQMVSP